MLIFHGHRVDIFRIDLYSMAVNTLNLRSKMADCLSKSIDIADIREIIDHNVIIGHDRRR